MTDAKVLLDESFVETHLGTYLSIIESIIEGHVCLIIYSICMQSKIRLTYRKGEMVVELSYQLIKTPHIYLNLCM